MIDPAKHRVPIKDGTLHMDAYWRGLTYEEMVALGKRIEAGEPAADPDPESLI
jgi:hypothetical protein